MSGKTEEEENGGPAGKETQKLLSRSAKSRLKTRVWKRGQGDRREEPLSLMLTDWRKEPVTRAGPEGSCPGAEGARDGGVIGRPCATLTATQDRLSPTDSVRTATAVHEHWGLFKNKE